jgi:hypothetical protein
MTQKTGLQGPVPAYNILRTAFRTGRDHSFKNRIYHDRRKACDGAATHFARR